MSKIKTILYFTFFLILIFLGYFLGSKYLVSKNSKTQTNQYEVVILDSLKADNGEQLDSTQPTPTSIKSEPSLIQPKNNTTQIETTKTTSQISPEGKMLLTLEVKAPIFKLYTSQVNQLEDKQINELVYTGKINNNQILEIPFNTWSPDNKYFFIKKTTNNVDEFLLFNSNGEAFNEEAYLNVSQIFVNQEYPYDIKDTTGWASNAYLVIQTTNKNTNSSGPSYWFNVYNSGFIQLSTNF